MSRARRIAIWILVSVWLPALLHCRLEAAGLLAAIDCCAAAPAADQPAADHGCSNDSCATVEGEFTSPTPLPLKAPAPTITLLFGRDPTLSSFVVLPPPPPTGVRPAAMAPPELARPWVLISPGPLSPRAP